LCGLSEQYSEDVLQHFAIRCWQMTGDYSSGSVLDTCSAAEMPDTYSEAAWLSHKNHCSIAAGNSKLMLRFDSETAIDQNIQVVV